MMKQKSWWLLTFSIFAILKLHGQSASECWHTALQNEKDGQYNVALQKFARINYFKPDTLQTLVYLHIGNCETGLGEYYKAINSYDDALLADIHNEHQTEIQIQKLKAEILVHNMRLALLTIKEIDTLKSVNVRDEVLFYEGAIHFYKEEYPDAEKDWLRLVSQDSSKQQRIKVLFRQNKKINRLKPGIAIALSIVLPGAGQIYAGDIKEGINSLLLTGGLFVLGYNTGMVYNVFNAIVAVGPWFLRYYQGGILRAGDIVKAKRAQRHKAIYSKILEALKK